MYHVSQFTFKELIIMAVIIGFAIGALTTWICYKIIDWDKDSHKDDAKPEDEKVKEDE